MEHDRKYWEQEATKEQFETELIRRFSDILNSYVYREPIYNKIHDMKDLLDSMLMRCK
jgi:uncharacterized protein YutD